MIGEVAVGSSRIYGVTSADVGHSLSCVVTASNGEGQPVSEASESQVVPKHEPEGSAPEVVEKPMVYGERELGSTVYCAPGTWSGKPTPITTIQWLRDGLPIPAATQNSYTITEADQAHLLSCRVSATNSEGIVSVTTNTLRVKGVKPAPSAPPEVSGTPALGQELTCLSGTWKGVPSPALTYQWLRDGASISFATSASYVVRSEDRGASLSCRVSASNGEGVAEAVSNSLEIPGRAPKDVTRPKISGTATVGGTLLCASGTWSGEPAPEFTFHWLLNGVEVPSASTNKYTVASSDRGLSLSCQVTGTNSAGAGIATSDPLHVPGIAPQVIEAPEISGSPAVGSKLTCERGLWDGAPPPAFVYQWLRDGTIIASATSAGYTVELSDQGHELACNVVAINSEGKVQARSKGVTVARIGAETRPEPTFGAPPPPPPTRTEILAALRTQLARAQHHAHIAALRKAGSYAFKLTVPVAGTLRLVWYLAAAGAQHAANGKPFTVATATTSLTAGGTKTVSLRLTNAGWRLIEQSRGLQLTLKAVFAQPHTRPLTWQKTVGLTY
jgi:hypothetical protein